MKKILYVQRIVYNIIVKNTITISKNIVLKNNDLAHEMTDMCDMTSNNIIPIVLSVKG